jgi:hypothetical protein
MDEYLYTILFTKNIKDIPGGWNFILFTLSTRDYRLSIYASKTYIKGIVHAKKY